MGFGSGFGVNFTASTRFKSTSSGGALKTAAGLTALVALARADGASAGDLYQDSNTGRTYQYQTAGAGMLIPVEWYSRVSGILEYDTALTDNGPAYITVADATADLTGRGWTLANSGGAPALTKTAGQPLILDTTGGSGHVQHVSNATTAGTIINYWRSDKGVLSIMRVKQSALPSNGNPWGRQRALIFARNGAVDLCVAIGMRQTQGKIDFGTDGGSSWSSSVNNEYIYFGAGTQTSFDHPNLGSGEGWILVYLPPAAKSGGGDNEDTQVIVQRLDVDQSIALPADSGLSNSSSNSWISSYNNASSNRGETREIYEWFLYKVV